MAATVAARALAVAAFLPTACIAQDLFLPAAGFAAEPVQGGALRGGGAAATEGRQLTAALDAALEAVGGGLELEVVTDAMRDAVPQLARAATAEKPNLVWFITDDQDQVLGGALPPTAPGGATPMPRTKRLMQDGGAHAENWYIHTPICAPSRAELLTGRYFHNVRAVGNTWSGIGMHVNYTAVNDHTFLRTLKEEGGYTTGLFGKYLNLMPDDAPVGFDAWFANGGGNYIAPSFQTKGIEGLPDGMNHFNNGAGNYSTALIGNVSRAWIQRSARAGKPFMAYIAPKAAHEPYNPAPWHADHWDPSWPEEEPRPESWNCSAASRRLHHGNIASQEMMTEEAAVVVTGVFKNRWRTLMAVDDVIGDIIQAVDELGLSDSTYFFYSSDHGFQLGEFNILMGKRHPYEYDVKIHMLARGPGILPGSSFDQIGTQVDIAPTLLGFAGVPVPPTMDGKSVLPFLLQGSDSASLLPSTRHGLAALLGEGSILEMGLVIDAESYAAGWRTEAFLEYYFVDDNVKCVRHCGQMGDYPRRDSWCANLTDNTGCWCYGPFAGDACYPTESKANNWIALRRKGQGQRGDTMYVEFQDGDLQKAAVDFEHVDHVEYFDVAADPWAMNNLATDPDTAAERSAMSQRLRQWLGCSGAACP